MNTHKTKVDTALDGFAAFRSELRGGRRDSDKDVKRRGNFVGKVGFAGNRFELGLHDRLPGSPMRSNRYFLPS